MPQICPAILARTPLEFSKEISKVGNFAERIQVDLTDGVFVEHETISPNDVWWPAGVKADIHLMYEQPEKTVEILSQHKPNLIIVHAESKCDFEAIHKICEQMQVKLGLAILPQTAVSETYHNLEKCNHALIFSGNLGEFGGHANLSLLDKVTQIKTKFPNIEIGWDGGVNDQNVASLVFGGVDVLDVGGFLQNSPDPARTYLALQRIADETGET